MSDAPASPPEAKKPEVQIPPELLLAFREQQKKDAGRLRWGVLGCSGVAIVSIVGLVLLSMNAREMLDTKLTERGDQVLMRCAANVTVEDRNAFKGAVAAFLERVKSGELGAQRVAEFREATDKATSDGTVTSEELAELTRKLR